MKAMNTFLIFEDVTLQNGFKERKSRYVPVERIIDRSRKN